ncbi:hypothetical protein [Microbulbifer thermotolerans]|uniref:Uncharacterized protein n=1 Tax=Microbulbifer thermotolerans TaxID=252514 RepID=A0AB35I167_MICTH|nr:hypothetical protein [Microbulbifer thermotolerans]MCX2781345.1 hypothetical protein [Microbulbifer thermotolerans]MCX2803410.1 hypothetical protein [Microbulbifer thermotolerans]MCX2806719.1 hypothetical protein [Microbulbifer thermotolerans]MCX2843208.1 hypothetical protein [Microbulbifer thermotolerans]
MKINHHFKKDGNRTVATTVNWENGEKKVSITIDSDVSGLFSEELNQIVIEDYSARKILFYSKDGRLQHDIPLPTLEGYSFRGLNKNNTTKTGISLIFNPETKEHETTWNDMVQYELLINPPYIGKFLGIYR